METSAVGRLSICALMGVSTVQLGQVQLRGVLESGAVGVSRRHHML
jgi:hypothetical protein